MIWKSLEQMQKTPFNGAEGVDFVAKALRDSARGAALGAYLSRQVIGRGGRDVMKTMWSLQRTILSSYFSVAKGERSLLEVSSEQSARAVSGLRFASMVQEFGGELFGSATLEGEEILAEDEFFRLTYIPAKEGVEQHRALFHVGGVLPYGDPLFRLTPGISFFERFTEKGMPVYAMELKGDAKQLDYRELTLSKMIDAIDHFSDLAFEHRSQPKMVLEGYCGLAPQALAFVAAKTQEANKKFSTVATFVGPVDGRECKILAEISNLIPESMVEASYKLAELFDLYVTGDQLRLTQDIALGALTQKTWFGSFAAGFNAPELATVKGIEELSPYQQRMLAGAYWISPENCRRFPVPTDIARFSSHQFTTGVEDDGLFAGRYHGVPINLKRIFEESDIEVYGFYGGKDHLVPDSTAHPLQAVGGDRYHHVVHKGVGHVGYILSPKVWREDSPKALNPNPVALLKGEAIKEDKPAIAE